MSFPEQITSPPQAQAEVLVNRSFDTLKHQAVYGKKHSTTSALTWGYYGGRWGGFSVDDDTLPLTGSSTNYLVVEIASGDISVSTSSTNWNDSTNYVRVYKLTTDSSSVTAEEDHRAGPGGVHGGTGTGGGGGTGSGLQGLTFTSDTSSQADSDPGNGVFKWSNATQASATTLYLDAQTADAVSLSTFFAALVAGGLLYMQQEDDVTRWQMWRLRSIVPGSGYYKVNVALLAKGADIQTGKKALFDFQMGSLETWAFACSDQSTAITTGTGKGWMHAPYDAVVLEVQAGLDTPQASGSIFTVDINEAGATILSTKLTIDNTEDTSTTAATPAVISDNTIAKGAKITADVDQIGTSGAKGLTVYMIVSRRTSP